MKLTTSFIETDTILKHIIDNAPSTPLPPQPQPPQPKPYALFDFQPHRPVLQKLTLRQLALVLDKYIKHNKIPKDILPPN